VYNAELDTGEGMNDMVLFTALRSKYAQYDILTTNTLYTYLQSYFRILLSFRLGQYSKDHVCDQNTATPRAVDERGHETSYNESEILGWTCGAEGKEPSVFLRDVLSF
jgi:hypothetical protein